ncbi:TetR/AcrR family transcriptional regulator [Phycicoccus endophyticus]|uniref:TetR/AcrR family transcriptional regulator n=1 Tax=Phycicoccus endophyticus TaxID=1690220 RepID=A0A7G9R386_9MICO|nr:TetR/AcrR family transcriptional regulator [Phycicoccus endophyticus]NHI19803.1 TetR/AcrR family transcriptional regulator [Phycicoccus endophyticus]QNN50061.1 TetR/AcrR family transcriptional regulator [Phycicoccus endophyticus]GGL28464.1 putative transcriptional regulator, TetR family protein [Phycicoccus endophyticus]
MQRLTRTERQENNRRLLIDTAERIFGERGVDGASLDDVASAAGLTKGAVYSNFGSKGDLILAVIRHRLQDTTQAHAFQQVLDDPGDEWARLDTWCDVWVDTARAGEQASYARLLLDFMAYALRHEELRTQLREVLRPHPEAGRSLIPRDSGLAAVDAPDQERILLALDVGLSVLRLVDPDDVDPELYRTAVTALVGSPRAHKDSSQAAAQKDTDRHKVQQKQCD